jgi:ATP-dependent Clp protease protease subunit
LLRGRLNEIYANHTGQQIDVIADAVERDNFMSPQEAKEFGLVGEVVSSRPVTGGDGDTGDDGKSGDGGS